MPEFMAGKERFEKIAASVFLLLLIGLICFLTWIEVPDGSKQLISAIIGGLMLTAAQALPKLFGAEDREKENLRLEVIRLSANIDTLQRFYDRLVKELLRHHVIADQNGLIGDHTHVGDEKR